MPPFEPAPRPTTAAAPSTYRVQLSPAFTFIDAAAVLDHLADLGVTHLYVSPIFQAAPDSTHGYDVTDSTKLSDDLGGSDGFTILLRGLQRAGLGLMVDIVPNHMSTDGSNRWWWDVLEDGPRSVYAKFFDIDWSNGRGSGCSTVLVPLLADHYGRVLEDGRIALARDGGTCTVRYEGLRLPIAPTTLGDVLGAAGRAGGSTALVELADALASLPDASTDARARAERLRSRGLLQRRLAELLDADLDAAEATDAELKRINASPDRLDVLLQHQHYRLARWRTAGDELDYRRFFNIDALIGMRVEDPEVFEATHALALDLVHDGAIDALRVDHIDGLRDPTGYLERLAQASGGAPVLVEKILAHQEPLAAWPVDGTTGYDFLARVNQLFVDGTSEQAMTDCYQEATGADTDFASVTREAKRYVMAMELGAEVDRVTEHLIRVCDHHRRHRDHTRRELRDAVTEFAAALDVYRTYWHPTRPPRPADLEVLRRAGSTAEAARPDIDPELLGFLAEVLGRGGEGADEQELALRFQQLSAPVMAKGVEDTAFYRFHRLISLNEVGDDPGTFGQDPSVFHAAAAATAAHWPGTMLALSTHDTKRSADVRARISVLSEEPEIWRCTVRDWIEQNAQHWRGEEPDRNAEYLLYQTLLGAWPLSVDRAVAFMTKAVREAKVHTSWTDPHEAYEAKVERFIRLLLADPIAVERIEAFLASTDLVDRGRRCSLAQTTLLLTSPGQPDIYQGTDGWDLSLADPDNRRPVDFDAARRGLTSACRYSAGAARCSSSGGEPKPWLTQRLLRLRAARPELFHGSGYEPVELVGAGSDAIAFQRGRMLVVTTCRSTGPPSGASVALPRGSWTDHLTGRRHEAGRRSVADLLATLPAAVLIAEGDA